MKSVLVIGGGGRCHAIVDALSRSEKVDKIYCAPGNAGISSLAQCVSIKDTDVEGLLRFAKEHAVDLTVVGPEASLAAGVVDAFRKEGLLIFGHTKAATQIESSKNFAKELMSRHGIPTATYRTFSKYEDALEYVRSGKFPVVLKYDGLAAGKGVVIAENFQDADTTLRDMLLDASFGEGRVVVEEFLTGPEFSFMCFVNGEEVHPMPLSQDHKRVYDGDCGPNTGGMGAYTSLPFITKEDFDFALNQILKRVAKAMKEEGMPLSGVLYGGLMKTQNGIKVIEFNARFGDPETEVVLPLLKSDIYDIFEAVASQRTCKEPVWSNRATLGIVLASKGYPAKYEKGFVISGLDKVDARVYHMGTTLKDGQLLTSGGRVLMVVCEADSLKTACQKANIEADKIQCTNLFHRRDIGHKAFEMTQILDGKALSLKVKEKIKAQMPEIEAKYGRTPSLAVIIVGENPASCTYVRNKVLAAQYIGFRSIHIALKEDVSEQALLEKLEELNRDDSVDGILVQLPLPKHISEEKVISAISYQKDVDGFHPMNVASLWLGKPCTVPCTPKGVMEILKEYSIDPAGKKAVVVGRSNIVGKPMAKLLLDSNATVTIAHSRTANLREVCLDADILVAAVGKPAVIGADMIKKGAVVIDVGVNRGADNKLCGDVDYNSSFERCSAITPVPGGVGPMTIAMLMQNTLECFLRRMKLTESSSR
ncbi:MAG: phosphoribosylamine--glycine ligase [Alistipes sp.]|nr:phosphoribosylamine--glycine ligase [Candidatus Alistipes equi]